MPQIRPKVQKNNRPSGIGLIKTLDSQLNLNLARVNSESANRFVMKRETVVSQLSDQIGADQALRKYYVGKQRTNDKQQAERKMLM